MKETIHFHSFMELHPHPAVQELLRASVDGSPAVARVGRWMAAHPVLAVTLSAEEVANACGGSLAAVNRFAKHAGYEGFADLRLHLGRQLQQALEPVNKLRAAHGPEAATAGAVGEQAFGHTQRNLQAAAQACDPGLLDQLAQRICRARRVLFMGFGSSHHVAAFGADVLQPYLPQVVEVTSAGGSEQAVRRMTGLTEQDVLIAISLPRYSREAVALTAHARQRGALTIAITDEATSPLAREADYTLLAPASHPLLPSSPMAAMAMVEALATQVIRATPQAVRSLVELSESVLPYLTPDADTASPAAGKPQPQAPHPAGKDSP
ncbi:putative HTH-type transcriptional regulator YbbH|uniref:MurR/RpiR family transcriptional regulator n=2 Tax=Delftia acidovorans TaxID=80866 RepID=UPI001C0C6699|nr:MurR/RpiR family transcriptional regulator [Delftia acidovorans]MCA1066758.1 putative HTH-type transcriptional regulator YbbH [Delftia acidovorans]